MSLCNNFTSKGREKKTQNKTKAWKEIKANGGLRRPENHPETASDETKGMGIRLGSHPPLSVNIGAFGSGRTGGAGF